MSLNPRLGTGRIRSRNDHAEALHRAEWSGSQLVFDHSHWSCEAADLRWSAPHHLIVLTESGTTERTKTIADGELVYDGRDQPGALTFVPANVERVGAYRHARLNYSALWIAPNLQLAGCDDPSSLPVFINRSDAVIRTLLCSLSSDLSRGFRPETVYVEHLAALVLMRIRAMDGAKLHTRRHGKLGAKTFATVRDYIETHIATDISLSDLASLVGMKADTFARRFKATTGLPPYAYVLERRTRRAAELLSRTDLPVSVVAHSLGYSSQSHLTATLRRTHGVTPRALRAARDPEN
ncbi:helix-turn-helix transcriptional regulator [Steroidobacter sp. S1-65]|uniref:Helix-turn-helix transcriptional regulator n=1 Tax=Steroidobacter gossypii TaxID=2805490 RepID=A0ABS1X0R6_9GAMM|nr:AraC family transcriptional regulator [Steroidobacter gossypii]MBM0106839.1 helix-turn-helix transcriptional regulator [Steroidobacter gossypii]